MAQAVTGVHCIVELYGCPANLLNDVRIVRETLEEASRQGMSTLLNLASHAFDPQGVTAVALLAESHISIHTWPELGYAAVDAFTCGDHSNPERAVRYIAERLQASHYDLQLLARGGHFAKVPSALAQARTAVPTARTIRLARSEITAPPVAVAERATPEITSEESNLWPVHN